MRQCLVQPTLDSDSLASTQQSLEDAIAHLCSTIKPQLGHDLHGSLELVKISIKLAILGGVVNSFSDLSRYIKEAKFLRVRIPNNKDLAVFLTDSSR